MQCSSAYAGGMPSPPSAAGQPALQPGVRVDTSSLPPTSSDLFGRDGELNLLDSLWDNPHKNIVVLAAWPSKTDAGDCKPCPKAVAAPAVSWRS